MRQFLIPNHPRRNIAIEPRAQLEKRVADLEAEIARLKKQ